MCTFQLTYTNIYNYFYFNLERENDINWRLVLKYSV